MVNIKEDECTGCALCMAVCPVHAIKMVRIHGFDYPEVDHKKCIDCGLCEKKCPAIHTEATGNFHPKVYAAWVKNEQIRKQCTSGGICYELSKQIIGDGGFVAGVEWTDNYRNARYFLAHKIEDLSRLIQTKYFQPVFGSIYKDVEEKLKAGKTVLFIGTACTNAALRMYLGKEYCNLFCCDFICRGYSSQTYHEKRVEWLEGKHHSSVSHIQYKNKDVSWKQFGTKFIFGNGEEEYISSEDDPYEIMFHKDDFNTRPSCFICKYRDIPRLADITVGDFWGVKGIEGRIVEDGISAVLIHSQKGDALFRSISDHICMQKQDLWNVERGNSALRQQLKRKPGADRFFEELNVKGLDFVHKKYGKRNKSMEYLSTFGRYISLLFKCNPFSFLYYNFLNHSVVRKKHKYLFPFYGAKMKIDRGGKLILENNLFINTSKHKGSNEQTYLRIYPGGVLRVIGRVEIMATSTIDVLHNAELSMGDMETNYGCVIICSNKISLGDGTGIGRNVMIYDSNYHDTGLTKRASGKPLVIEDHVWLCSGVTISKGIRIGAGAICGLNSTVTRNVKSRHMVLGNPARDVMSDVEW